MEAAPATRRWACARPPVLRDRAGRSVGAGNFLVWRRRNNTAPDGGTARRALPPPVAERCEGGAPLGPPLPPEPPAFPPSPLPSPRPTHPRPAMPDQISVSEFVSETNEDYKSPTASNFTTRMAQCRNTVAAIEEVSPGRGGGERAAQPPPAWLPAAAAENKALPALAPAAPFPARPRGAPSAAAERKWGSPGWRGGRKGGGGKGCCAAAPGPRVRAPPVSPLRARPSAHGGAGAPATTSPASLSPGAGEPEPSFLSHPGARGSPSQPVPPARSPSYLGGNLNSPAPPLVSSAATPEPSRLRQLPCGAGALAVREAGVSFPPCVCVCLLPSAGGI